tara:strand:+ start:6814 stop:8319 length:1506 start_codon:yes stop_codon:yes gene_type:complete
MTDNRLPENRRKVFLDFYEFHLKYGAHAGAVYYAFPYLFKTLQMTEEQKLWFVFINGNTQNVVTTYRIYSAFPSIDLIRDSRQELERWFETNYNNLPWDTDRRYTRTRFIWSVSNYIEQLDGKTQADYFAQFTTGQHKYQNFSLLWDVIINKFVSFGRLSTFSYLEYLRLAGINVDCDWLFFEDITGSKSHRNGLCKVLGRDDLDWTKDNTPNYTPEILDWLNDEGNELIKEAKATIDHPDVSYFTLETTLCCYKGWHRVNRRYPNVYNDMFYDRIRKAEELWGDKLNVFWDCRKELLPKSLRLEENILDKGLSKEKQNHYRLTGQVIMMEEFGYKADKTWLRNCILIVGKCGVGKTWVMSQLLKGQEVQTQKLGKFLFHETPDYIVVGKYDGSVFQGSDRLSMSVMTDLDRMLRYVHSVDKVAVFEGDRFTNSNFIAKANPAIVKVLGDGRNGRLKRGSNQTERHLKSISTRVDNIVSHCDTKDSEHCLEYLKTLLNEND